MTTTHHYTPKQVQRRYTGLMLGSALGYVGALFGVIFAIDKIGTVTPTTIALGIIPGLFVLTMLYSLWRYIKEVDEVARFFIMRSLVIGAFGVLAVAGTWGLLEMVLDDLPKLPVFWMFPLFFFAFGIAQCLPGNRIGCRV